jgi:hypothetical protein
VGCVLCTLCTRVESIFESEPVTAHRGWAVTGLDLTGLDLLGFFFPRKKLFRQPQAIPIKIEKKTLVN